LIRILKKIRPAEWVVLVFLLISIFTVSVQGLNPGGNRWDYYPIYQILLIASAALILKALRNVSSSWAQKSREFLSGLRLLAPLLITICLYPVIPTLINSLGIPDQDVYLNHLDTVLFLNHPPQTLISGLIFPALSEWMAFAYSAYGFILLFVIGITYLQEDARTIEKMVFCLTTTLALGYCGYALVPAVGPVHTQTFPVDLGIQFMKGIKEELMDHTRIEKDCFPSLHTAITWVVSGVLYQNQKKLFRILLPVLVSIPIACIYLRYHYVVDVIAGVALSTSVYFAGERLFRPSSEQSRPS
jgi:membrane-associated phospholipid phosphatase